MCDVCLCVQRSCSQPEDVPVLERLSHMVCQVCACQQGSHGSCWHSEQALPLVLLCIFLPPQMCFLKGERLTQFTELASRVLYHLSALHFHSIYTTKIVYK